MFGPGAVEGALGDDLGGGDALGVETGDLVALGESSLSEQFGLGVLLDDDLAVGLGDLFLNNFLVEIGLLLCALLLVHSKYIYE